MATVRTSRCQPRPLALACAALLLGPGAPTVAASDDLVAAGEVIFHECAACHMVGNGAVHSAGPHLNGVVGRTVGTVEGFVFSEPLTRAGHEGQVWDAELLHDFLRTPQGTKPGTWMYYDGLADEADRNAVIAFLEAHADDVAAEGGMDPQIDAILAIEADAAYGAYLSSECTTCHKPGGSDIPDINGLSRATFAAGLLAYRNGSREHQVMTMLAGRLGDDEIAALAAYFEAAQ